MPALLSLSSTTWMYVLRATKNHQPSFLAREMLTDNSQLYLVHFPVAFQKGDSYFPLVEGSTVEGGDVIIDDDVSIVDTWRGE